VLQLLCKPKSMAAAWCDAQPPSQRMHA
jgi:hypothetical protein